MKYVDVNNHIHTTYSFSPYAPAEAVARARAAGLSMAGIMDHDSIAGAPEFIEAGAAHGLRVTVGLECRASLAGTPYSGTRVNNPDQAGIMYFSMHAVPHNNIDALNADFAPLRALRNERNKTMLGNINDMLAPLGATLNFERDVLPLSEYARGGSVTERHLCRAFAEALINLYPHSDKLLNALEGNLTADIPPRVRGWLTEPGNAHRLYDIIGVLKASCMPHIYVDADAECLPLVEAVALCRSMGGIPAYAYLGDVGDSVTGDKRAQAFEDAFLDELFPFLRDIGFQAVTYMPTRNTDAQIRRVRALCAYHGLLEICGEDINTPRQSFICEKLREPSFAPLRDAAFALVAHEARAERDPDDGLFGARSIKRWPNLSERVGAFASEISIHSA